MFEGAISLSQFKGDNKVYNIDNHFFQWTAEFIDAFNQHIADLTPFVGKLPKGAALKAFTAFGKCHL